MTFSSDSEISHIARSVLDKSLPKSEWTHAAHFAAALWMLAEPNRDAIADMPDIIRAYNLATGVENTDSDGYHETITLASIRAARAYLNAAEAGAPLYETLNALLATRLGASVWLLDYWSKPCLFSVRARRSWVNPDLAAFPFN
ncbi:MAG: hypothetical protein ABJG15_15135 [Hyphomonadaceae bacterium]